MSSIPASHQDLLEDGLKTFANLATTMKDGTPQVSPVWFEWDGEHILINTARGRLKDHNMRARPYVALSISDPRNPYRYLLIRGRVVASTEEGGDAHIDRLSQKYHGRDYDHVPGQVRVIYTILPEHVRAGG